MALRVWEGGGRRCLLNAQVEVVVIDGFSGFKSVTGEELPKAQAVMDPYARRGLAAGKLDECRRIQRAITGRPGCKERPALAGPAYAVHWPPRLSVLRPCSSRQCTMKAAAPTSRLSQ